MNKLYTLGKYRNMAKRDSVGGGEGAICKSRSNIHRIIRNIKVRGIQKAYDEENQKDIREDKDCPICLYNLNTSKIIFF